MGVVLGTQNPFNSIIPEVRFSSLFPTPLREADGILDGFWEVLGSILDVFWRHFWKCLVSF